jgi:hypothetical protein
MGLKHGAQVLYALKGLSAGDVVDICKKLAEENGTSPTIDVDCSNIFVSRLARIFLLYRVIL